MKDLVIGFVTKHPRKAAAVAIAVGGALGWKVPPIVHDLVALLPLS